MTQQALNRPVDVLGWIRNTPANNGWKAKERDAVANAVAELIDAASEALMFLENSGLGDYGLRAALATVEGQP